MVVVSMVAGALAGVIWGLTAPGQHLFVIDEQHVLSLDLDSNNIFVAIAMFVLFTALAGVLCGAVAWAWRSVRGPGMGLGVMAGGLVGTWLAAGIGGQVSSVRLGWPGTDAFSGVVDQMVVRPPAIDLFGADLWVALLGQALAAGLVYMFAAGLSADSDLGVADLAGAQPPLAAQPALTTHRDGSRSVGS